MKNYVELSNWSLFSWNKIFLLRFEMIGGREEIANGFCDFQGVFYWKNLFG